MGLRLKVTVPAEHGNRTTETFPDWRIADLHGLTVIMGESKPGIVANTSWNFDEKAYLEKRKNSGSRHSS
jgi:hypothetical protein